MPARPGDWSPLGLTADPAPGDPVAVRQIAETMKRLAETAGTVHGGLKELQNTSGEGQRFVGKTADALREKVDEHLHRFAGSVQESFLMAESALRGYADALEKAQTDTGLALTGAQSLPEDDPQRQNHAREAEAARGELAAAVTRLSGELTTAGQRMKMPVSDCEIFWEVFEIFTIIFSVLAIFTGGLLGLVAWAMNVANLVKVAVDYSQGKASGLQLGLAFLGVLFPSTKGIGGTLKAVWKGIKAGAGSFSDDAARLALLTGTSKLVVMPIMLIMKTGAGFRALPFVVWNGAKFLGRAPGKDWTKITGQITGGSAKFAAYGKVTMQRLGRFTTALFLPLNMAEIGVVGYRGAAALAFGDRVLGIPQHSLRQMMVRAGDLEYINKAGRAGGAGLGGAARTGLFGAVPPGTPLGTFNTDLFQLSFTRTPSLDFTTLGFAKLDDLLLSRPGAAAPGFTGGFTPATGGLGGTVPLGTSGLVTLNPPGGLTAGPGGLLLPGSVAGDSALNPLTRLDASMGQVRLESNLVLPADTALGIIDGARHPAGLSLVTETPGAARGVEGTGFATGTVGAMEESTALARGAVAHAEDLSQIKLPELIALQQGDIAVRGVNSEGISFRIGESTDVTVNAETLTSLAFTSRGATPNPLGTPGAVPGAVAAPGPAPVLQTGPPPVAPAAVTPPATVVDAKSVPLRATVVASVRTTAVSAVPTGVPAPAAVAPDVVARGAGETVPPPAANHRDLALALIGGDGKRTGAPAGLSATAPGGGVSSRTALDTAGVPTAGADARLALDLITGPGAGSGRSATPPAVPAGQPVLQPATPVPAPAAGSARVPGAPGDGAAPVPPPAASRTVPEGLIGPPAPVPTRIEGHAAATIHNQLRHTVNDIVTGGTPDPARAALLTERYVRYETALAELNAAQRGVRETAPSTPGAGSSSGPTRAQTEAADRMRAALTQVTEARKGLREAGMDPDKLIGEIRTLNTRAVAARGGLPGGSNPGEDDLARLLFEGGYEEYTRVQQQLQQQQLAQAAPGPGNLPGGGVVPNHGAVGINHAAPGPSTAPAGHLPPPGAGPSVPQGVPGPPVPPPPLLRRETTFGLTGLTNDLGRLDMNAGPSSSAAIGGGSGPGATAGGSGKAPVRGGGDVPTASQTPDTPDFTSSHIHGQLRSAAETSAGRGLSPHDTDALVGAWSRYDSEFTALQRARSEPEPQNGAGSSSRPDAARENWERTIEWRERRTADAADDLLSVLRDIDAQRPAGATLDQSVTRVTGGGPPGRVYGNRAGEWNASGGWPGRPGSGTTWADERFHGMGAVTGSGSLSGDDYLRYVRELGQGPRRQPAFVVNAIARATDLGDPARFGAFLDGIAHRLDRAAFENRVAVVVGVNGADAAAGDWNQAIRLALSNDRFPYPLAVVATTAAPPLRSGSLEPGPFPYGTARNQTLESPATRYAVSSMMERGYHPYVSIMDFDAYPHVVPGGQHVFAHFERVLDENGGYPLMMGGGYRAPGAGEAPAGAGNYTPELIRRVGADMAARVDAATTHPLIPYVPEPNLFVDGVAVLTDVPAYRGARNTRGEARNNVQQTLTFGDGGAEYTTLGRRLNQFYGWELDRSLPLPVLQGVRSAQVSGLLDGLLGTTPPPPRAGGAIRTGTEPVVAPALGGDVAIRTQGLLQSLRGAFSSGSTPEILNDLSFRLWQANAESAAQYLNQRLGQIVGLRSPVGQHSLVAADLLDDMAGGLVDTARLTRVLDRMAVDVGALSPEQAGRLLPTDNARRLIADLRDIAGNLRTSQAPDTLRNVARGLAEGSLSPDVARTRLADLADGLTRALPKLKDPDLLKNLAQPGGASVSERLRTLADQVTMPNSGQVASRIQSLAEELGAAIRSQGDAGNALGRLGQSAAARMAETDASVRRLLGELPQWARRQTDLLRRMAAGTPGSVTLLASERRVLEAIRELFQERLAAREMHAGNLTLPNRGPAFTVDFENAAIPTDLDRLQRKLDSSGQLPQDHSTPDAQMSRFLGISDTQTSQKTAKSGVKVDPYVNDWLTRTFPEEVRALDNRIGAPRNLGHNVSARVPGGGQEGALTAGLDPRHYREHAERLVLSGEANRLLAQLRDFRDRWLFRPDGLGHRDGGLLLELNRALGPRNFEVQQMLQRIANRFDPAVNGTTRDTLTSAIAQVTAHGMTPREYFVRMASGGVRPPSPAGALDPGSRLILEQYSQELNRPIRFITSETNFLPVGNGTLPPLDIARISFNDTQGYRWAARPTPVNDQAEPVAQWLIDRQTEFTRRHTGPWPDLDGLGRSAAPDPIPREVADLNQARAAWTVYGQETGNPQLAARAQRELHDADVACQRWEADRVRRASRQVQSPAGPAPFVPVQSHTMPSVPPVVASSSTGPVQPLPPAPTLPGHGQALGHGQAPGSQPQFGTAPHGGQGTWQDVRHQQLQQARAGQTAALGEASHLGGLLNQALTTGADPQVVAQLQQDIAVWNQRANQLRLQIATLQNQLRQ
ncbi:putative T7SS-secreted protein [Streptomyces sp. NPDC020875]|uniref:putative T7SS-secreted protein n=1 Tax=Streptomyces sp. NPDC020875 TaxID=3154898 RepID=UPI0033DD5586